MEIYYFYITLGMIMATLFVGIGVGIGRLDKREHSERGNMDDNIPVGDGNRSGNNGHTERMDAEEVIDGLQDLRMALSRREQEYLDYACECVLKVENLERYNIM